MRESDETAAVAPPGGTPPAATTDPARIAQLLRPFRIEIDSIDDQIVDLLARRFGVVTQVAGIKHAHGIQPVLPDRVEAVKARNQARAEAAGIDGALVRRLYDEIVDASCALEARLIADRA